MALSLASVVAAIERFAALFNAFVSVEGAAFEFVAVDVSQCDVRFAFLFNDYVTGVACAIVARSRALVPPAVKQFGALTRAHGRAARAALYLEARFATAAFSAHNGLACRTRSRVTQHGALVHTLE